MNKKWLALVGTAFLVSLLSSLIIVQSWTGAILETRRTALVERLAQDQLDGYGAFPRFRISYSANYFNDQSAASALLILKILNSLGATSIESAVRYVSSLQNPKSGGFGIQVRYDGAFLGFDMHTTYEVVWALDEIGALQRVNQSALADFVLARYNQSSGTFSELVTEVDGRRYAVSSFLPHYGSADAFAIPNVMNTFSAVSILARIGSLDLINETKILDFIVACQAGNGLFRPFPNARPIDLTNPFDVDGNGTGIPYTYAAVGALKALGRLELLSQGDREKIAQYILACQTTNGKFYIHQDSDDYFEPIYTNYAVLTLDFIGMQEEAGQALLKVQNHIMQTQQFNTDAGFPLPLPATYDSEHEFVSTGSLYGLFQDGGMEPLFDTLHAILTLNATNGLSLLDQPTTRSRVVLLNIAILSTAVTALVLFVSWGLVAFKKRKGTSSA